MFYLYGIIRGQRALVLKDKDIENVLDKLLVERICWSDEGARFMLTDYEYPIGSPALEIVYNYDDLCESITK